MKLLLSIFAAALCIGSYAQDVANNVFYKEGLITDLTQLKDGDYIVLQNVNTGFPGRNGYVEKNGTGMNLKTNQNMFSKPESNEFKNTFSNAQVFQVTVSNNQYKFRNVAAGEGYILNNQNTSSDAILGTSDANNTFTISVFEGLDKTWSIQSTANNVYLHGEDGRTIYYGAPHPYRMIKVTTENNNAQHRNWYTVRHKDTRPNYRMYVDANKFNFLGMKDLSNNTGTRIEEAYLLTISENPSVPEECTFVTKGISEGSMNWVGVNKTEGTQTNTHDANTRFAYDLTTKHYNLNMVAPTGSPYPYATFRFQPDEEAGKAFYINQSASGQGYYINYYSANDGTYAFTFSINAQLNETKNGYALGSFIAPFRAKIPTGVDVYTAQESDGNLLLFKQEGTSIPANTAVILKAEAAGFYEMLDAGDNDTDINTENNILKGCAYDQELTPSTGAYILSQKNEVTAMYSYTGTTIPMYRAYLPKNNSTQQIKKFIFKENGTTGIQEITTAQTENSIYDLSGRKVINPRKGIYIQNGKKFIVK